MKRLILALLMTAVVTSSAIAQVAVVIQPVHLRADLSTIQPPLRLFYPPERLQLIPPKEEGDFYRVRTDGGETGWVWKRNVSVYKRDNWMKQGKWLDSDGDCQDTRHDVLIVESSIAVTLNPSGCRVIAGQWQDPYGGETFTNPSDLDIDHLVPLAHAHVSGGWA